jgi:hypothetical protein
LAALGNRSRNQKTNASKDTKKEDVMSLCDWNLLGKRLIEKNPKQQQEKNPQK